MEEGFDQVVMVTKEDEFLAAPGNDSVHGRTSLRDGVSKRQRKALSVAFMCKSRASRSGRIRRARAGASSTNLLMILGSSDSSIPLAKSLVKKGLSLACSSITMPRQNFPDIHPLHDAIDTKSLRVLFVDRCFDDPTVDQVGIALASKRFRCLRDPEASRILPVASTVLLKGAALNRMAAGEQLVI